MAKKKTDSIKNDLIPKRGGSPSKAVLYEYASQYTQEAFDRAIELMRTSRNESIVLGAVKIALGKTMPDLSLQEHTGSIESKQSITIINYGQSDPLYNYISSQLQTGGIKPTGIIGSPTSGTIPGPQLAQKSTQDDTSDKPVN